MPKFAANLTMLFSEYPFLERFKKAREAGFDFVEYLFPYDWPVEQIAQSLKDNNLQQVLFNLPPGNWSQGERGLACLPDRQTEFELGLTQALDYARILGVTQVNCLAGLIPEDCCANVDKCALYYETLRKNLGLAADYFAPYGIDVLIEPINSKVDMPRYCIDTFEKAAKLLSDLKRPNIKIQFDLYHMQIMQGDLLRTIESNLDKIGHIQFADNPGRHEPSTGEINFKKVFEALDRMGYAAWVAAEYHPSKNTESTLDWLQTFN